MVHTHSNDCVCLLISPLRTFDHAQISGPISIIQANATSGPLVPALTDWDAPELWRVCIEIAFSCTRANQISKGSGSRNLVSTVVVFDASLPCAMILGAWQEDQPVRAVVEIDANLPCTLNNDLESSEGRCSKSLFGTQEDRARG